VFLSFSILIFSLTPVCAYKLAIKEDVKELEALAEQGNVKAQEELANHYLDIATSRRSEGKNTAGDMARAMWWFNAAAEQGSTIGWDFLVGFYRDSTDTKTAADMFLKGAELGSCTAQVALAEAYYNGRGIQQDYEQAAKIFKYHAERSDKHYVHRDLGEIYFEGRGLPRDYIEAYFWLSLSNNAPVSDPETQEMLTTAKEHLSSQDHEAILGRLGIWQPKERPKTCPKLSELR